MDVLKFKLTNAPIIEAVLDIDCEMPLSLDINSLESVAKEAYRPKYPVSRPFFVQEHRVDVNPGSPNVSVNNLGIQGFHFLSDDQKQIAQVKVSGFSFNRLAPYASLSEHLPEMEWAWKQFVLIAAPIRTRVIRLRYINRILIPAPEGKLDLKDYLNICPQLPDETNLEFVGFFNQHAAIAKNTGDKVNIVLARENSKPNELSIIFDITVERTSIIQPEDWAGILTAISGLRVLKNTIFINTLNKKCIDMFGLEQWS